MLHWSYSHIFATLLEILYTKSMQIDKIVDGVKSLK